MPISALRRPMALALSIIPIPLLTAQPPASASGWVEVKGQRTVLSHAFAALTEDALEGGGKEKIELLLSDRPVPPEFRKATDAWSFWAGDQARKGELHGIIVYLNPETRVWSRGQRLSRYGMEFYSQSGSSPELNDLVFTPASTATGEIAGKVSMKKPMRAVDESEGPWQVEAEFRTPIIARPAVTASLTGDAARNSAPYKAVQGHLLACQKRDLEAIRRSMNSNAREILAKFEAAQGRKALLDMFAGEAAEALKMKLVGVTVRGDSAEVAFAGVAKDSGSRQVMRVILEDGAWKIGQ